MSFVTDLFGGPDVDADALRNNRPVGLNAGGLRGRLTGSGRNQVMNVTAGPERRQAVQGIQDVLRGAAGEIGDLRDEVRPGFGRLTEARVGAITNRRQRALGNLRENLQRRRVLGSSFGQDALSRAEAEFGQAEAEARAQSFLEELDVQTRLIDQETQLRSGAFQTALQELNFQADVGTQLATQATQTMQRSAEIQAQIAQQQASGIAELVGTLAGPFLPVPGGD